MSFEQSSLSAVPRPQTSLVGRQGEMAAIAELLRRPSVRMVTLTGPGGSGKTRLALHTALTATGYPGGRWFVELAGLSDPALIVPQIGQALGLPERGDTQMGDQIVAALDGRDALLVLDNFEHLLEGATAVSHLLSRTSDLTILTTSRSPLNLAHEYVVPVGALGLKPASDDQATSEAVQLFLQRSRAIRPGYDPAPADLRAIEEICRQLSGLPLAIELAAARLRVMAPQALLSRLSQPLRLLSSGPNDAPARHRSMRDAIDWSYRLLPEDQRALLRAMGIFMGSVPLDGIEVVAANAKIGPPGETIDLIERLVDASMIEPFSRETKPRFLVYATVREFLLEELARNDELDRLRELHAAWVEALSAQLMSDHCGPREHLAFARLRAELGNLRAAIGWALESGDVARAVRIVGNLADFWSFGGQSTEGKRWVDRIIPLLENVEPTPGERHRFWMAAGLIAWAQGDAELATERYRFTWELSRELGDPVAEGLSLMWQAQGAWYCSQYEEMHAFATAALAVSPPGSTPWAGSQTLLGIAEMRLDRLDRAEATLLVAVDRHTAIGFTRASIWTLQLLADLALLRGDHVASARAHRESMNLALESSNTWAIFEDLSGLIAIAVQKGWTTEALELLASAELLMTTSAVVPREGSWLSAEDRQKLKAGVTSDALEQLANEAASRSLPQFVDRASEIAIAIESGRPQQVTPAPVVRRAANRSYDLELSLREQEVLTLLVEGKTDRQISAELGISHGTARTHVAHVLQKLDARNRAAAVRKALELELV